MGKLTGFVFTYKNYIIVMSPTGSLYTSMEIGLRIIMGCQKFCQRLSNILGWYRIDLGSSRIVKSFIIHYLRNCLSNLSWFWKNFQWTTTRSLPLTQISTDLIYCDPFSMFPGTILCAWLKWWLLCSEWGEL